MHLHRRLDLLLWWLSVLQILAVHGGHIATSPTTAPRLSPGFLPTLFGLLMRSSVRSATLTLNRPLRERWVWADGILIWMCFSLCFNVTFGFSVRTIWLYYFYFRSSTKCWILRSMSKTHTVLTFRVSAVQYNHFFFAM